MKNCITLLFILNTHYLFAQKQGYNWYFGAWSAVTFNSGKPKVLTNSVMFSRLGSSTISSSDGKLQFYSNGRDIFNLKDSIMVKNLGANNSTSAQNSLIVPWPDSSHLYYIFTPPMYYTDSVRYTIINMKLNRGLGDTVSGKKSIRMSTLSSGKINAIRHANHHDYWIVMPSGVSDSIHAYLITSKGISTIPVKSKTGIKIKYSGGPGTEGFGYFKLSPDGKKLCDVNYLDSSMVADFDNETGRVSNVWGFNNRCFCMSAEFSPKSNYLYMPSGGRKLVQYDLNTKNKTEFLASKKTVDSLVSAVYSYSCFQVAPDGKIYFTENYVDFLHVINAPDSAGKYSRVQKNVVTLAFTGDLAIHTGLPDFIQSFFHKPNFRVRQNCANDTVFFTIKDTYQLDSVHWHFGDTASGALNFSTQTTNVFHHYKKMGNYKVRLISFHKGYTDTIYETFLLKPLKPYIGKDTNFCKSKFLSLSPNEEFAGYKWSNSQTIKSIYVTNPGNYILTVSDYSGCKGSDTIKISKPVVKADFTVNDSNQCFRVNDFKLKESTTYTGGLRQKSSWFFKDSILSKDSLTNLSFNKIGSYPIKLVSESFGGCRDSISKTLNVYPNIKVGFTINDSSQCLKNQSFNYTNTTADTGKISYQWDLGDQTFSSQKNIIAKNYLKDSSYVIKLISTTDKNCKDTATKLITVKPSPKADFTWDIACSRTVTKFQYTGSKPIQSFHWNFKNEATSSLENPSHKFASAGTFTSTLALTSSNGCNDTLKKTIEIKPQSQADFTAQDVCENSTTDFENTSKDATSYLWKFGDGQTTNLSTTKHKYQINGKSTTFNVTLVAIVANGCSDSISKATTVNANPKSDFGYTTGGKQVNFTATETAATQYQWTFGDGGNINTTTPKTTYNYTKFPSGKYTACLKTINAANCFSESCKEIEITGGIANLTKQGFKIYPNPNNGSFTIELDNPENDVSIEIFNLLGKVVKKMERVEKVTLIDLNVAEGIYLVRVKNGGSVWSQKVSVFNSN